MNFSIHAPAVSVAVMLIALIGCVAAPSMGGPERVALSEEPFVGFAKNEDATARWLAFSLRVMPDKTLSDPVAALETFSQFEWTANAMKGVYIHMTPVGLRDLADARHDIRDAMNIPREASVADAILAYAARAKSVSDADRRLLAERSSSLKVAMVKAGRVFDRYNRSMDDSVHATVN